jgi:hypothetical protein
MKKESTREQIMEQATEIRQETQNWESIHKSGCSDPFWPDGVNLNLIHNHICYEKDEIRRLCKESEEAPPPEFYFPTPPIVDENFFAVPNSERAKKIKSRPGWKCANLDSPGKKPFDDSQMSLF